MWGPPSCMPGCGRSSLSASPCPAPYPCEMWGPPSCMPRCGRPSSSASTCPAPDPPVFTGYQDGSSTLATVTLDQSAPHQLASSMMDILVEGHRTSCLFDTGSTESFIDPDTVQRCGLVTQPVSQRVTMASGSHSTDIRVGCVATLVVQGTEYRNFALLVMPQLCAPVLLGLDFQSHLESVTVAYDGPLPPLTVRNPQFGGTLPYTPLLTAHTHRTTRPTQHHADSRATDTTCSLSTLKIPPPSLFANLTPDCKLVATKSRRYSAGDRAFIQLEVQRLLREGIIEPSTSPWRPQVVVVRTGQKNRMVLDYSQTINRFTQLDAYPLPRIAGLVNQMAQYKVYSTIDLKSAYHQLPICPEDRPYTAFEAGGRLYHFLRVPFGVTNGVSIFQREMDRMVDQYQLKATFPYLEYITICGRDWPDHNANL
ncbi:proline-serine-threonine phosphatase-interacting protein 1a isoform X1 [Hypanus sabinus]|uniref:proline-serine-threonine phosphatase-interacting protein 1a isoform X1 n=1 Tax=Hypanus sabinus TaxID=79690 RepID=UPI0028C3D1B0|nr:proline-serine-threonine phosphatase-interacting protein 1a isoform X1 [Hypanus sabinus]